MIAVINYGAGNLYSITRSLEFLGIESKITDKKEDIETASHIILPGVGAFGDAVKMLENTGLIPHLDKAVANGKPFMGICLGMQLLFEKSYEFGEHKGLGYLNGVISPISEGLEKSKIDLKVPQMGWNNLKIIKELPVLKYSEQNEYMYFVHSFYAKGCESSLSAYTDYGIKIPAVCGEKNIFGCQFHPEKSGSAGLKILKAFSEI